MSIVNFLLPVEFISINSAVFHAHRQVGFGNLFDFCFQSQNRSRTHCTCSLENQSEPSIRNLRQRDFVNKAIIINFINQQAKLKPGGQEGVGGDLEQNRE